jgi:hypothetical protein
LLTSAVGESPTSRLKFWTSRSWILLSANIVTIVHVGIKARAQQIILHRPYLQRQPALGQVCEHYEIRFAETMREFWNRCHRTAVSGPVFVQSWMCTVLKACTHLYTLERP